MRIEGEKPYMKDGSPKELNSQVRRLQSDVPLERPLMAPKGHFPDKGIISQAKGQS